ncbi:HLH-domain-containing protein [Epithele typhae]|uniref:HLH-domain-containing protein n=1 Tax=Epithele typhae TaxID=378194 RepID=UPI002007A3A9|nr:HLH-domain-containing protein [Epithele typhae]KAH9930528.1 HLH-domain-containing protein [Epithele typhae]
MSSAFFPSFKPQVLSRTEGFHLPSPPPSNSPPSPPANPTSSSGTGNFDNLFVPPLFSVPDSFRKFPSHSTSEQSGNMDFSDELASLIATPSQAHIHNSSHERSTQSPGAYDDYRSHHTHNIFDISAPTSHHQSSHHFGHQNPSFSLPPHPPSIRAPSMDRPPSTAHIPSTSSTPTPTSTHRPRHRLFHALRPPSSPTNTNGANPFSGNGGESSSFQSHMSNLSNISSFSNMPNPSDFHLNGPANGQRHTPSPSRSRSRAPAASMDPANPPSTNGGPARRTRTKRNSVSSVSPPPLIAGTPSPLGLPTPESVHGFSAFNGGTSLGSVGLGVSPKDANVPGMGIVGMQKGGETPPDELATKQAIIANEKRRRRRESHNAVERRRRDNINEKISELATLIPECLLDPNATMTVPASLSQATNEDLIFGVTIKDSGEKKEGSGSAEPEDMNPSSTPTTTTGGSAANTLENNAAKANKGMILRKSVEYIRYLQQLVGAQATRNRDLEQQLQAFRSGGVPSSASVHGDGDGDGEMKLHDEVDGFLLNGASGDAPAAGGRPRRGSVRKGFNSGFGDLPSVEEMDQDTELEMERPSTAGTGVSPGSSLDDDDVDDEGEEDDGDEEMEIIERGRKGRDGRPVGKRVGRKGKSVSVDAGASPVAVKVKKEADGMEIS